MLDFLNPNNGAGLGLPGLPDAQPEAAQPSPAAIIEMARAMREQREKELAATKQSSLPAMYDSEGRKLGPVGVLCTLRGQLRRARAGTDQAEIKRLEALMVEAEAGVEVFIKKSGLSRAQLFPTFAKQAADQEPAIESIAALRKKHDELEGQIKQGGLSGRIYRLRLLAQYCRGESALLARQAGLIEQTELAQAGRYGFWALMPPVVAQAPCGGSEPADHQLRETVREIAIQQDEGDRS